MWQAESSRRTPDPGGSLEKVLPVLSVFTMVMTVPQVWAVWVRGETAGVSLLSWGAYLLSACLWFFYGLRKRDRNIYVACIGWVLLDAAVVAGVIWHG
ncbi:MAG TPA: SemiSWEET family transporter [Ramlibacter sp.]|nr:SemiSWEET family transporter [Ramlibacter sp.]